MLIDKECVATISRGGLLSLVNARIFEPSRSAGITIHHLHLVILVRLCFLSAFTNHAEQTIVNSLRQVAGNIARARKRRLQACRKPPEQRLMPS